MPRREALLNASGFLAIAGLGALGFGGAGAAPDGLRLGLPSLAGLVGVLVAIVALFCLRAPAAIAAPLAAVPLILLIGMPIPGLAALSGPPLLALFAGLCAALLAAAAPRWAGRALLPAVVILYMCVAARVQSRVGPEGDEPHYLMVADSLLHDHDLDLTQDYALGRYRAFHEAPLEPHFRIRGKHGEVYSLHAIGLSILILPAYALFGYAGASFFMAILGALLVREIRRLVFAFTAREELAIGVAWAVALSPPLVHYAGLIFTEVPAAFLVAVGLRWARDARKLTLPAALAWGSALGLLPWLNVRYALVPVILVAYGWAARPRLRTLTSAVLPLAASAIGIAAFQHALYGFFDPRGVYGRRPEFSLATLLDGLPGLLFDQEFGLLVYAPLFALAAPGLVRLWRSARRDALVVTILVLSVLLTAGTWDMWRGGFNPPARFLVPVVPALAVGVAMALGRGFSSPAALLVGWSLWTGLAGAADPALVHRDRDGTAPFFRAHSGAEEWTRLLPSYVLADEDRHRLAAVWALALCAAIAARGSRPSARGLALSTLGLMAAAAVASQLSHAVTEGRDAARLAGRQALTVPGWRMTTTARWGPGDLRWGPLYEPHRHPDGAAIGDRLRLAMGAYRVELEADPQLPLADAPELELRPEAKGTLTRTTVLTRSAHGWAGDLDVRAGEEAGLRLALRGGSPFILKAVALDRSTLLASSGLIP
jgi:hypothetical protein